MAANEEKNVPAGQRWSAGDANFSWSKLGWHSLINIRENSRSFAVEPENRN